MSSIPPGILKKARVGTGLSQAEVGEKVGVTRRSLYWEQGHSEPSSEQVAKLNKILGLSHPPEESDLASPLAEWLKKARDAKHWSVPELAEESGLTPTAIYRIEHGLTRNLRESTRQKLENASSEPKSPLKSRRRQMRRVMSRVLDCLRISTHTTRMIARMTPESTFSMTSATDPFTWVNRQT